MRERLTHGETLCGGESEVVATQMSICSTASWVQKEPVLLKATEPVEGRLERNAWEHKRPVKIHLNISNGRLLVYLRSRASCARPGS